MTKFGRCCICTSSFTIADVTSLKCGHTFHGECIRSWINNSKTCPHCRKKTVQRDIVKMYFDEADMSFTQSSQEDQKDNVASTERMEELTRRLTAAEENNQKLLETFGDFQQKVKSLKSELKSAKARVGTLAVKEERIRHLEALICEQNELRDQLEQAKARVKASEFFSFLTRRGERGNEKTIDDFLTKSGDVDAQRFIELIEGQNKKLNDTVKRLESDLELLKRQNYEKTEKGRKAKQKIVDQKNEIDNLRARLEVAEKTRVPLQPLNGVIESNFVFTNNSTPAATHPKKSFGFSFVDDSINTTGLSMTAKHPTLVNFVNDAFDPELSAAITDVDAVLETSSGPAIYQDFDSFDNRLTEDNVPVASSVTVGVLPRKAALPKRKVFADRFNKSIDILDELEVLQRERSLTYKTIDKSKSSKGVSKTAAVTTKGIMRFLNGEVNNQTTQPKPVKRTSCRIVEDDDEDVVNVVTPENEYELDRQRLLMAPRAPKARQSIRSAATGIILLD